MLKWLMEATQDKHNSNRESWTDDLMDNEIRWLESHHSKP